MTTTRRSALGLIGAASLTTGTALAAGGSARADATASRPGRVPAALRPGGEFDRYVAGLAAEDLFSGTVLLAHRDRPVLQRSYGMADKERSIPNGPDTVFNTASITKTFTGVAIAQLAQQGKVSYGEKLGAYLDGFAADVADTVTVHQLLTHTSGLGRPATGGPDVPGSDEWDDLDEIFAGTMEFIRGLPLTFVPGSRFSYSNDAYFVLGAIVAQVSGTSYYDYVREHVFRPAGMTGADFHTTARWRDDPRIAHPYDKNDAGDRVDVVDDLGSLIGHPAAGIFARATDLARFATAFQDDTLLDPAHSHVISSPKLPASQDNTGFIAYSMIAKQLNDQWINGHGGGSPGVSANLDWFPGTGWAAVVLANYGDNAGEPVFLKARDLITRHHRTR